MAKRLKDDNTKDPNNKILLQKAGNLYSIWRSKLSPDEYRILDAFLGKLDPSHPDKRKYTFSRGEMESLLGRTEISAQELSDMLSQLMGSVMSIYELPNLDCVNLVTIFEGSESGQSRDGKWTVSLQCTMAARKHFLQEKRMGYFRYKLRSVSRLKSRYSFLLFCYIENNRHRGTWLESVDSLRDLLGCYEPTYELFKNFRALILKPSFREILEKTECQFEFDVQKTNRFVTGIRFTIHELPEYVQIEDGFDPNQISLLEANVTETKFTPNVSVSERGRKAQE